MGAAKPDAVVIPDSRPMSRITPIPEELLVVLTYELLDALDDTTRLAAGVDDERTWEFHLDYVRQLQRVGREVLANATAQDGPAPDSDASRGAAGRTRRVLGRVAAAARRTVGGAGRTILVFTPGDLAPRSLRIRA
jgi:hypothetical protein